MAQPDPGQDATKPMTDGQQAEVIDLDALDALPDIKAPPTTAAQPLPAGVSTQQQLPSGLPAADQQAPPAPNVKQEEVKREGLPKAGLKEEPGAQVQQSCRHIHMMAYDEALWKCVRIHHFSSRARCYLDSASCCVVMIRETGASCMCKESRNSVRRTLSILLLDV